jgi:glutaconate CoA-transferase subunit A
MDRFKASQENFTFWPAYYLGGNDVLRYNPDIKEMTCPLTGRKLWAIPPSNAEACIIHALLADELGHVYIPARRASPQAMDITMARSCDLIIVTVEKIVPAEQVRRYPDEIELLPFSVACIVEAPYGAHPCAMTGAYAADSAHLKTYVEASKDKGTFDAYLEKYVTGVNDHMEYLERIGVRQLMTIRDVEVMA